jgi:sulfur carrier protein
MNIYINSKQQEVAEASDIVAALQHLNLPSLTGIAIAINNAVIPKAAWSSYQLCENDQMTIIKATQGG